MNDLLPLFQIVGTMAIFVVPPVMLAWLLAGFGPVHLAELFRGPSQLPWPRGVQENDLPAFRLDRFDPKRPGSLVRTEPEPEPRPLARVPSRCTVDRAA